MAKRHSTEKMLIISLLSLILSMSLLVGTTFAWFTDSVESKNNIIKSGKLDVELYYQQAGKTEWKRVSSDTNMFMENAMWEPGHTELIRLKIVNEGNLAFNYQLGVGINYEVGSRNWSGEDFLLSDSIYYGIIQGGENLTRAEALLAVESTATALKTPYNSTPKLLVPKDEPNGVSENIVTLVVYVPENMGNEANPANGEPVPQIKMGISLIATQSTYEEYSSGN